MLTVTQMLRKNGVVGKFVEFFGPGCRALPLADRATIANMAPEYGATSGFFPVDDETLALPAAHRPHARRRSQLVERYCKEQGLFRTDATPDAEFTDTLELDLGTVEPSLAGPKRPQDRVPLRTMKQAFREALLELQARVAVDDAAIDGGEGGRGDDAGRGTTARHARRRSTTATQLQLTHGSVVIAAITSCTNTSNPSVMLGAGLLAKKAVERGLTVKPWVKTSLAPGSQGGHRLPARGRA